MLVLMNDRRMGLEMNRKIRVLGVVMPMLFQSVKVKKGESQ